MPRINQLPSASSVAQTDVLAIDTPEKTYQVPRSVLAPAPYIATIPTGQWSGSGSDYYITVTASNVTADAMLYPFYDNASAALLNGPVWVIPAEGSFTIHTTAIPSGTVTISVLLAGIVGEVNYQVLADVYSRAQVDAIVSQSTAIKRVTAAGGPFTTGATVTFTISGSIPTWVYLRGRRWGYRSPLIMINVTEDAQTNDDNFFILRDGSGENSVAKISWKGVSGNTLSMKIVSNSGGELYFDLFYT